MKIHPPIRSLAVLLAGIIFQVNVGAQDEVTIPANIGGGLEKLVAWNLAHGGDVAPIDRRTLMTADHPIATQAQMDAAATMATVNIRLDGKRSTAQVRASLEAAGCVVLGAYDIGRAGSIVAAKVPLARALQVGKTPGVLSLMLAHRPHHHANAPTGKVTSQGAAVVRSDKMNDPVNGPGVTGSGITVGVVSDSYDLTSPHAAGDIASGDLPSQGVNVLQEATSDPNNPPTDEGRAMLQIVHDMAPDASLAFATSGDSQVVFASNIKALRTDGHADVIVDDISFSDEPFFSDGPVALAVDDVVNSTSLAGRPVAYYSAAGNEGTIGLDDVFRPIADTDARTRKVKSNLRLSSVPTALTAGGFHNFGTAEAPVIVQKIKVSGDLSELVFQWDDPFIPTTNDPSFITTDYNILVFNSAGTYISNLSGIDDNFSTAEALEFADLPSGARGAARSYQIAITRRAGGSQQATHLRYVVYTAGNFQSVPFQRNVPTIFGHAAAHGADAVAAYDYSVLTAPEDFSSTGPVTIYFDRTGARLNTPEVRMQPTMAAPDNVDTTFFPAGAGNDTDGDGFPNFSGTSAAAPHAAGVAALLLASKGGSGSRTSAQLRTALQGSSAGHDLDPGYCKAITTVGSATVTLEARGDNSNNSSADPRFFKLSFDGAANLRLTQVVINLTPTTLVFDPSSSLGLPFQAGAYTVIGKRDFAATVGTLTIGGKRLKKTLTVKLKNKTFAPGATLEFGMDRDLAIDHAGGNSADLLEGATVTVTTIDDTGAVTEATGTFANSKGTGYTPVDGFGLIDAYTAFGLLSP